MKDFRNILTTVVAVTLLSETRVEALAAPQTTPQTTKTNVQSKMPMFEYLKFDKNPQFDVIAKTQEYIEAQQKAMGDDESWYAEDYVLRGPVIGPIGRKDLRGSQNGLGLMEAFPDVSIESFGFTVDPENPYRVLYFQRWRATHTQDMDAYGTIYPASNAEMETPLATFSVVWNPDGRIVYEQVGAVVDRLEGNTQGKAAVFGMLHTAGLKISGAPGDGLLSLAQRIGHFVGGMGRSWSKEKDIPEWFVSTSRGADGTEQW